MPVVFFILHGWIISDSPRTCIYTSKNRYSYINFEKTNKQHTLNGILPLKVDICITETGRFIVDLCFHMSFIIFQVYTFNTKNDGKNCT